MKHIVAGLIAHVDAGKTTLSEALMYHAGKLRQLGRVDNQDAFLDTDALEKARGITIYSHTAQLETPDLHLTLVDTPGHLDFAAATEAALSVLDYAVLVVSATAGVQAHTRTLWRLLARYQVPTFLFINKLDAVGADADKVLAQLQAECDPGCVPFGAAFDPEAVAVLDDAVLTDYLETGALADATVRRLIAERKVFPVYAGAALKLQGVADLLAGLSRWTQEPDAKPTLAARVFKITHAGGERLSWLRVFGGVLRPKQVLVGTEKINQLRVYDGDKYTTVPEAGAGAVCVVPNLVGTHAGMGIGALADLEAPRMVPVLRYALDPLDEDIHACLAAMQELNDEDPQLAVLWHEALQELTVRLMGTIQVEVLTQQLATRYHLTVAFKAGGVLYQETITEAVEGVGHFEPLRHYAEVHLRLEPAPRGSGIQIASECSLEVLGKNWQHQVLANLTAKTQRGVLIGAPLTDVRITLVSGRASIKHSVGGDFREATWRALRQGLMMLKDSGCQLLEPWYRFELIVPQASLGRAMTDVERMAGVADAPQLAGDWATLTGVAPVKELQDYAQVVRAYTHGAGTLSLVPDGYRPAHDADAVIESAAYSPTADLQNTPDSVFCAHGAGYPVAWDQVPAAAHVPYQDHL